MAILETRARALEGSTRRRGCSGRWGCGGGSGSGDLDQKTPPFCFNLHFLFGWARRYGLRRVETDDGLLGSPDRMLSTLWDVKNFHIEENFTEGNFSH